MPKITILMGGIRHPQMLLHVWDYLLITYEDVHNKFTLCIYIYTYVEHMLVTHSK